MQQKVINLVSWGGIGDGLLATSAFKALKEKFPQQKIRVFCLKRHKEIYKNNRYIDSLKEASFWKSPYYWLLFQFNLMKVKSIDYSYLGPHKNYSKNVMDIIGEVLGVDIEDQKMQIFLTEEEEKKAEDIVLNFRNPIVINPSAMYSKNKEWFVEKWEELIKQMPDYTFIQVGLKGEPRINGAVDLRGTKIRDSVAILKKSMCYVGVDSFMSHAAVAVDTPAVILFGPSSATIFGHKVNTNIYKKLPCSPCIDLLKNSKCPYNKKCMKDITVSEVRQAVMEQLGQKEKALSYSTPILEEF